MSGSIMQNCKLCPRACGADRTHNRGLCGANDHIEAARASLHLWEEPPISGTNGSGTVFFHIVHLAAYSVKTGKSVAGTVMAKH